MRSRIVLYVAIIICSLVCSVVSATYHYAEILPVVAENALGTALAGTGDELISCTPDAMIGGTAGAGLCRVVRPMGDTFDVIQFVTAPTPVASTGFGSTVATHGDWLIVGSNVATQEVFVFHRASSAVPFTFVQHITVDVGAVSFGATLAMNSDTLVVSAPADGLGSLYVYSLNGNTWAEHQIITGTLPGTTAFGSASLALSNAQLVVGVPTALKSPGAVPTGAATVYEAGPDGLWAPIHHIMGVNAGDVCGASVAVSNGRIAVGSSGLGSASIYIWDDLLKDYVPEFSPDLADLTAGLGAHVALTSTMFITSSPTSDIRVYTSDGLGSTWTIRPTPAPTSPSAVVLSGVGSTLYIADRYVALGAPASAGGGDILILAPDCPPGMAAADQVSCTECVAGTAAPTDSLQCVTCHAGSYQPLPGQPACDLASLGNYVPADRIPHTTQDSCLPSSSPAMVGRAVCADPMVTALTGDPISRPGFIMAPSTGTKYGTAIAYDEATHTLYVGAPNYDEPGLANAGTIVPSEFYPPDSTWSVAIKADALFGANGARMGERVFVTETYILTMFSGTDVVRVFRKDTHILVGEVTLPGSASNTGHNMVELAPDTVLIACVASQDVKRLDPTNAMQVTSYAHSPRGAGQAFGSSIALTPDRSTLFVTAISDGWGHMTPMAWDGAAYTASVADMIASPAAVGTSYGYAVVATNDYVFVGAANHPSPSNIGAVHVYSKTTDPTARWELSQTLIPLASTNVEDFGVTLAVKGDTLVVGDPEHNVGDGRVYVYKLANGKWYESHHYTGSGLFGSDIAITPSMVIVGAPNDGDDGEVFTFSLSCLAGHYLDGYDTCSPCDAGKYQPNPGRAVCVTADDFFYVPADGLPHTSQDACPAGAEGYEGLSECLQATFPWEQRFISPTDPLTNPDYGFGWALAIDRTNVEAPLIAVSEPTIDSLDEGAVHLLTFDDVLNQWNINNTVPAPVSAGKGKFGFAVALSTKWLIASAPSENKDQGVVYVYRRPDPAPEVNLGAVTFIQAIVNPNVTRTGSFGVNVAVTDTALAILDPTAKIVFTYTYDAKHEAWKPSTEVHSHDWSDEADMTRMAMTSNALFVVSTDGTTPVAELHYRDAQGWKPLVTSVFDVIVEPGAPQVAMTDGMLLVTLQGAGHVFTYRQGAWTHNQTLDAMPGFPDNNRAGIALAPNYGFGEIAMIGNEKAMSATPEMTGALAVLQRRDGRFLKSHYGPPTDPVVDDGLSAGHSVVIGQNFFAFSTNPESYSATTQKSVYIKTIGCVSGFYAASIGTCHMCPPGLNTYNSAHPSLFCQPYRAGVHVVSAMVMSPCDAGTYSPTPDKVPCDVADDGYYVPGDGRPHEAQIICPTNINGVEQTTCAEDDIMQQDLPAAVAAGSSSGFGSSIAADDDVIIIGAPRDKVSGIPSGTATPYTYDLGTHQWIPAPPLSPPSRAVGDLFGSSVALSPTHAVVGSPGCDTVIVFTRPTPTTFVQAAAYLVGGVDDEAGRYGESVAIVDNWALVPAVTDVGIVMHTYNLDTIAGPTAPTQTVDSSMVHAAPGDFKAAVRRFDDIHAAFSIKNTNNGVGTSLLMELDGTWSLVMGNSQPNRGLAIDVLTVGDTRAILLGLETQTITNVAEGCVEIVMWPLGSYVLTIPTQFRLPAPTLPANAAFGSQIAVIGGAVAVSAPGVNGGTGMVYTFVWNTTSEEFDLDSTFTPTLPPVQLGGVALTANSRTIVADSIQTDAGTGQAFFSGLPCRAGYHVVNWRCVPCPAGYYSPIDSVECSVCDSGQYQPNEGSPSCLTADNGYHVPVDGAPHTEQIPCNNGTYSIGPMSTGCTPTTPGYFTLDDGRSWPMQHQCHVSSVDMGPGQASCTPSFTLTEIPSPTPGNGGWFGYSVAQRGVVLAIGAPRTVSPAGHVDAGAVLLYRHEGGAWVHKHTIHPPTSHHGGRFGHSIAFGQHLIITEPGAEIYGSVFTYSIATDGTCTPTCIITDDGITGQVLAVAATDDGAIAYGIDDAVKVYHFDAATHTHVQVATLTNASTDGFGSAMTFTTRDELLIFDRDQEVYLFTAGSPWSFDATFGGNASGGLLNASLATVVDPDSGLWLIVIGSPEYEFVTLVALDDSIEEEIGPQQPPTSTTRFGRSVTAADGRAFVSAATSGAGRVGILEGDGGWVERGTITLSDTVGQAGELAFNGVYLAVGSFYDDDEAAGTARPVAATGMTCAAGEQVNPHLWYTCTGCPDGHYSSAGDLMCTEAEPGYYVNSTDKTQQKPCNNGYYQPAAGADDCIATANGFHTPNNGSPHKAQLPCHSGHYQPQPGKNACIVADPGYHVPSDGAPHLDQEPCEAGTYQPAGRESGCVDVGPGYHTLNDDGPHTAPEVCHAGTYQPLARMMWCETADEGYYVPDDGQPHTTQMMCNSGGYAAGTGNIECTPAELGKIVPNDGQPHATAVDCINGMFQNETGKAECKTTPAGTYTGGIAAHVPAACHDGEYQPAAGQSGCIPADAGYHVPADFGYHTTQLPCDGGEYQPDPAESDCQSCPDRFSTPTDGKPHTACYRWLPSTPTLDIGGIPLTTEELPGLVAGATVGSMSCFKIANGSNTVIVPISPDPVIPASALATMFTLVDSTTETYIVTVPVDYTIPPPTVTIDGASVMAATPGPVCPSLATIGGLGPTPVLSAAIEGDRVTCSTGPIVIQPAQLTSIFNMSHTTTTVPSANIETVCITADGASFTSVDSLVLFIDGHRLGPDLLTINIDGAVCSIVRASADHSVTMMMDSTPCYTVTPSPTDGITRDHVYLRVAFIGLIILVSAACLGCVAVSPCTSVTLPVTALSLVRAGKRPIVPRLEDPVDIMHDDEATTDSATDSESESESVTETSSDVTEEQARPTLHLPAAVPSAQPSLPAPALPRLGPIGGGLSPLKPAGKPMGLRPLPGLNALPSLKKN